MHCCILLDFLCELLRFTLIICFNITGSEGWAPNSFPVKFKNKLLQSYPFRVFLDYVLSSLHQPNAQC